jgi:hypothetical protein
VASPSAPTVYVPITLGAFSVTTSKPPSGLKAT